MTARIRKRKKPRRKASQVAVLAASVRKPGKILLVTSRNSKSWSLAKGNVDRSLGPAESARKEAWEEAGVVGRLTSTSIGSYTHRKSTGGVFHVKVFRMHVRKEFATWPEKKQRQRRWLPVKAALRLIANPSLRRFIRVQFNSPT